MKFDIDIPAATKHNFDSERFEKELNSFLKEKLSYWMFEVKVYDFSEMENNNAK